MAKKKQPTKKSPGVDKADQPLGDPSFAPSDVELPVGKAPVENEDVELLELPNEGEETKTVKVFCDRDDLRVGDRVRQKGELLATVVLEHDVTISYLSRALEDCLARAVHVEE